MLKLLNKTYFRLVNSTINNEDLAVKLLLLMHKAIFKYVEPSLLKVGFQKLEKSES